MARKRRRPAMVKRPKNFGSMVLVSAVVLMIVIVVAVNSISLRAKKAQYEKKEAYLQEQIAEEEERSEEIEEYKKYMQTLEYIEEVAKEKLGLVHKDEIIFEADN